MLIDHLFIAIHFLQPIGSFRLYCTPPLAIDSKNEKVPPDPLVSLGRHGTEEARKDEQHASIKHSLRRVSAEKDPQTDAPFALDIMLCSSLFSTKDSFKAISERLD
jgi:hypothetical protein